MTITISDGQGNMVHSIIAPDEQKPARTLWAFLVAYLRAGLRVELDDGTGRLARKGRKCGRICLSG